jgi:hypothetical protein
MSDEVKSVQIYPSTKRLVPNFKLVKVTQKLSDDKFNKLINSGKKFGVIEKKNHKKKGTLSPPTLSATPMVTTTQTRLTFLIMLF